MIYILTNSFVSATHFNDQLKPLTPLAGSVDYLFVGAPALNPNLLLSMTVNYSIKMNNQFGVSIPLICKMVWMIHMHCLSQG